jgi:hypothetical protein
MTIEKLVGLKATSWQFLSNPKKYVGESKSSDRPLVEESTRQFRTARDILARLNGSLGLPAIRGVLLADDVGLGKTTVAALVAWVVASAGEKRNVRILAPNDVMMQRWVDELRLHAPLLEKCAPHLDARATRVKKGKIGKLAAGAIQVVKHSYAVKGLYFRKGAPLGCDLLIVDEAHRAKGEEAAFNKALNKQKKHARRVLILTATPFSIQIDELKQMLHLIEADEAKSAVTGYGNAINKLYKGNPNGDIGVAGGKLAQKAHAAITALQPFVIRHGIDDLPKERTAFGECGFWETTVPPASDAEVALIMRMDRTLRLLKADVAGRSDRTNDPRFHVGWQHLAEKVDEAEQSLTQLPAATRTVAASHVKAIRKLQADVGVHPKMRAVATLVASVVAKREKVLLFCDHIATAQELTRVLAAEVPKHAKTIAPRSAWQAAWTAVLQKPDDDIEASLKQVFISWLCSDGIRAQVQEWFERSPTSVADLEKALRSARRHPAAPIASEAAEHLFRSLFGSASTKAVLNEADKNGVGVIPGGGKATRVLGVCKPTDPKRFPGEWHLFVHNKRPDTMIAIFNSPFGSDALVVTDKLSEGIDLHRYCRHLIHYELDPSPIRTVQRNGRLRRVNGWAATTGEKLLYAYPAFPGTRDQRLVQIMKKRVNNFSILLGGVMDIELDEMAEEPERWRNAVIENAKASLRRDAITLRASER